MKELDLLRSSKKLTRATRDAIARKMEAMERDASTMATFREAAERIARSLQPNPVQFVPIHVAPVWVPPPPKWWERPDFWQPQIICSTNNDLVIS